MTRIFFVHLRRIERSYLKMGNQNKTLTAEQKSEKKKSIITTICVILAAVIVIGLVAYARLADSGVILRSKTAAKSENYEISGTMMAYYFNQNYQTYYSYLSYLGVDTSKKLKDQACSFTTEANGTWFDYFSAMTQDYATQLLALCECAKAAGVSLDDSDYATIDSTIEQMKTAAESYGYTLNQYLTAMTGAGVNEKDARKCMELAALASKYSTQYQNGLTYTDDQLESYYSANTDAFEGVDYYVYTVNSTDFMEKDTDGNPVGDTTTATAAAYEAAQNILAAKSEDEYLSLIRDYMKNTLGMEDSDIDTAVEGAYTRHALASAISSVADWAFSAKPGDVYTAAEEGDSSYAIYCLTKSSYRDETPTRNVRHILFSKDDYTDDSKAQDVYAELQAQNFSEDAFKTLAAEYSSDTGSKDNGGLYENVTLGSTANEFNAWLFDDARVPGDSGIVESSSYGWHIMYYVGEGSSCSWKETAKTAMKEADYNAMVEENSAGVTTTMSVIADIDR